MKLTQDGEVLAENKVLILYVLSKLNEPVTNDNLLQFVISVVDMNYFYFQQFLLDLLEKNYIICFSQDDGKQVYQITDIGREALSLTDDILPGIIKLKVDTSFGKEMKEIKEEEAITAEYVPIGNDNYTVTCKINENNNCIFEVSVFAGSREEAKNIVDNWKENAYRIYPEILNSLNH